MKLIVHVIEARNLPAMDSNGFSDPFVKLQLGKQRAKTKVIKMNLNPVWDEEFRFRVSDLRDELRIHVLDEDSFGLSDFLGKVKVPLSTVFNADGFSLGTQWYKLQPKDKKAKIQECGEIRVTISLLRKDAEDASTHSRSFYDKFAPAFDDSTESNKLSLSSRSMEASSASGRSTEAATTFSGELDTPEDLQESSTAHTASENQTDDVSSTISFDELLQSYGTRHQEAETPKNLQGVLIDQSYAVAPGDLNALLFSPSSDIWQSLAELEGTTNLHIEPWRLENEGEILRRVVTYTTAAKLFKAVKAMEEQIYLKADGKTYSVLASTSTPDVPSGGCFKTEILFCIMPGPELPSGEQSSRLVVSWRINFLQNTMIKSMIENGAKKGLKENYAIFADLLSKRVKPIDSKDIGSSKDQMLASLQTEPESDWKLAVLYFGNFTVISTVILGIYVFIHILLANPHIVQGLEFPGLDLPDSIVEIVIGGVLVLQGQRVLNAMACFMQARERKGSDHGVRAEGDGWVLTVALLEGANFAAVDSTGYSDPYVVFTCNGKTRTSSIKFQTLDPQWNEIFEFDAMDDPPSMMEIDVYDYDGPFDEVTSIGHAEINFVKSNLSELADIWIPLKGNLAQACQSKLHLRIFLNNTRGSEVVTEYLSRMEKEVGVKIHMRSPQTNSEFQKIFGIPPEEFLINDFTCYLKRKRSTQGRLFLSPRIVGFYSNLFGHKTKFFFLWEDIEDIHLIPSSHSTPSLIMILRRGRGMDAKHGAKSFEDGKLKFHFQSFVSFNVANRTIMALWRARSLSLEQKVQIAVEESQTRTIQSEDGGTFLGIEDVKMSEIFSSTIPIGVSSFMELFEGGSLELRIMAKVGCINYSVTQWESVRSDVYQRQVNYKFGKSLSPCGGEVTSTQQKAPLIDGHGWIVEEVMALHGVLFGDYFNLHLRYQIEDLAPKSKSCNVQVSLGIAWLKSTKHQKRVTKNVISNSSARLREMFYQVEKELTLK